MEQEIARELDSAQSLEIMNRLGKSWLALSSVPLLQPHPADAHESSHTFSWLYSPTGSTTPAGVVTTQLVSESNGHLTARISFAGRSTSQSIDRPIYACMMLQSARLFLLNYLGPSRTLLPGVEIKLSDLSRYSVDTSLLRYDEHYYLGKRTEEDEWPYLVDQRGARGVVKHEGITIPLLHLARSLDQWQWHVEGPKWQPAELAATKERVKASNLANQSHPKTMLYNTSVTTVDCYAQHGWTKPTSEDRQAHAAQFPLSSELQRKIDQYNQQAETPSSSHQVGDQV